MPLTSAAERQREKAIADIESLLTTLGFPPSETVSGRASVADLFPSGRRCGIYVLQFADGWLYCGQAIDVARRYFDHRRRHQDIERISFKRVARASLDHTERADIHALEAAFCRLRNIALTSVPYGPSDFDQIMPPDEQERWLTDISYQNWEGERLRNPVQRARYERRFQQYEALPFAQEATQILRCYVAKTIPKPLQSEMTFWICSCLPSQSRRLTIYSRISLNMQEVMSAYADRDGLFVTWQLARTPLVERSEAAFKALRRRYRRLEIDNHRYGPGGQDQIRFLIAGNAVHALLDEPDVLRAMRLFNLRLMKKRPCYYSRIHCLDLADRLLAHPD